jgi:hypothetical protein
VIVYEFRFPHRRTSDICEETLLREETVRITDLRTASIGAFVFALTLGVTSGPAEAGRVCNELDLRSPCINSSDLKARLNLDEDGTDARLRLRDEDGGSAVQLNAANATATNLFSNDEDESNGLVKAWAQINADGTIAACWRCNTDPNETRRFTAGSYEVDFTPLSTDVTGRPRAATVDNIGGGDAPVAVLYLADRDGDASSVYVDTNNLSGAPLDAPFVLAIY